MHSPIREINPPIVGFRSFDLDRADEVRYLRNEAIVRYFHEKEAKPTRKRSTGEPKPRRKKSPSIELPDNLPPAAREAVLAALKKKGLL